MQSNQSVIINSAAFKRLIIRKWIISITLTMFMLIVYFGFILTIAYKKEILASKLSKGLTIGIPAGIGIIIFAWILTGIYVGWANKIYDKDVEEFKNRIIKK